MNAGYPLYAPKVYIDQQLPVQAIQGKKYIGNYNEILIPYLLGWNTNCNLLELISFLQSVI